jgi:hypothetical protein
MASSGLVKLASTLLNLSENDWNVELRFLIWSFSEMHRNLKGSGFIIGSYYVELLWIKDGLGMLWPKIMFFR